ncbi:uncharacterized protein LOC125419323 [Ziziphus jujuba]|uniref:Uncharacterized protein LOC125419323 n=1 Tax=Ziziphus jujuba TaxID=326968 RepID=A0ABM3I5J6_ZIZJJ|nr:uncharacterized protein LOC125419323 [Ziziphus jujuba]
MESLSHVCKFRNLQELSIGVGEAVASLVYAASRCGELPELQLMRSLFRDLVGYEFEILNVELLHGNLVDIDLIDNLCINSIPDGEIHILIRDIAKEYFLPVENNFTKQHQNATCGDNNGIGIQASKYETARKMA